MIKKEAFLENSENTETKSLSKISPLSESGYT